MGDEAPAKEVPKTIESMREHDDTMIQEEDEEVKWFILFLEILYLKIQLNFYRLIEKNIYFLPNAVILGGS